MHCTTCSMVSVCSYSFTYVPVDDKTTAVKLSAFGLLKIYYKCFIVFINTPEVLPVHI